MWLRGRGLIAVFALVAGAAVGPGMMPAHAADANGCSGQATSFDGDGVPIDTAQAPGTGGTAGDPLDMLWAGTIEWSGTTDAVIQDGNYEVTVTPQRGGKLLGWAVATATSSAFSGPVANDDGKQAAEGTVVPSDLTGMRRFLTGVYKVDWNVTGAAGSCTGTGYVKVTDDPTGSVAWWVAIILILFGLTGLLLARPVAAKGPAGGKG